MHDITPDGDVRGSFFDRGRQASKQILRKRYGGATQPIPQVLADYLGLQTRHAPRRLRRKGLTFLHLPGALPRRHSVCRGCGRRTWTTLERECRRCLTNEDYEPQDYEVPEAFLQ